LDALNQVAALGTLVMSLLGLLLPKAAARFLGLQPLTPAGRSSRRPMALAFELAFAALLRFGDPWRSLADARTDPRPVFRGRR